MLYEMLAGRVPWEGDNALSVMSQHISAPVPPLHEINSAVPPPIEGIIRKCLRKNPDERYEDATSLARISRTGAICRCRSSSSATSRRSRRPSNSDLRLVLLIFGISAAFLTASIFFWCWPTSSTMPTSSRAGAPEPRGRDQMPHTSQDERQPTARFGCDRRRAAYPRTGGRAGLSAGSSSDVDRRAVERVLAASGGRESSRSSCSSPTSPARSRPWPFPPAASPPSWPTGSGSTARPSRAWLARSSRTCTCAPIPRPSRSWSRPACPAPGSSARS
jgi:serine/threonine protein kinase